MNNERHKMLTETPIPQLIVRLSIPTIISMLVTGIYNSADTYFVGRISTEATAAVGIVFSVMAIIQAMGFFCGQGSGNCLSRLLGAGNLKKANEIAATGFAMALLLGTIVAILGNLNVRLIASLIGASETSMDDTVSYLRIILLGAPFMMGQFVINNQLRFQGSAMYAMVGLLCGAIMNIGLDPLLMFGFGLGIKGAAIVTVLLNRVALEYGGDAAIAGMSIVTRILMMVSSVLIGFGQGYQPVCSYNYGAGRYDRVKEGIWLCLKFGTIMMTIAAVICFIPASSIVAWFRNDPEVIAVGTRALRWQASVLPTLAMTTLTNMMLQATGKGIQASITSSARNGIFFIPLIMILPRILGLTGVVMAQAIADICTVCLCIPFLAKALGTMK